jgi:ankyrin repeat protein
MPCTNENAQRKLDIVTLFHDTLAEYESESNNPRHATLFELLMYCRDPSASLIMQMLCERDPKLLSEVFGPNNETLLTVAVQNHNLPVVNYVLHHGVDANAKTIHGRSALSHVFTTVPKDVPHLFSQLAEDTLSILTTLLALTEDPAAVDSHEVTLLMRATVFNPQGRAPPATVDQAVSVYLAHILDEVAARTVGHGDASASVCAIDDAASSADNNAAPDVVADVSSPGAGSRVRRRDIDGTGADADTQEERDAKVPRK